MQDAVKERGRATLALQDFEDSLAGKSDLLLVWKMEIQHWECTKEGNNPYESRVTSKLGIFLSAE